MKRPQFTDLTPKQQATFGNGCGLSARLLNVPDFIFTASCSHHDFNFMRGCGATRWYENLWKAPFWYTKANWGFFIHMLDDAWSYRGSDLSSIWYVLVSVLYFVVVMALSFPWFTIGRWRTLEEITIKDYESK